MQRSADLSEPASSALRSGERPEAIALAVADFISVRRVITFQLCGSHSHAERMATIDLPWGAQSLYSTAQTAVSHLWYHDGQLNYVQALLGDGEVHWMEA